MPLEATRALFGSGSETRRGLGGLGAGARSTCIHQAALRYSPAPGKPVPRVKVSVKRCPNRAGPLSKPKKLGGWMFHGPGTQTGSKKRSASQRSHPTALDSTSGAQGATRTVAGNTADSRRHQFASLLLRQPATLREGDEEGLRALLVVRAQALASMWGERCTFYRRSAASRIVPSLSGVEAALDRQDIND
jgi:hypothetical protein